MDYYISQIRQCIAQGQLGEALTLLRSLLKNTPQLNEAIQQSRRNDDGLYNFSHRTFKEFFFAQLLYDGLIIEEKFPFDAYEDADTFYDEMGKVKYFQQIKYRHNEDDLLEKINYSLFKDTLLPRPIIVFCRLEGIAAMENAWSIFEQFLSKARFQAKQIDCLTDVAEYLIMENKDAISDNDFLDICERYDLLISDSAPSFFFCQTKKHFHFIHRAFAEFFCLRDILLEQDLAAAAEVVAQFPFDKLRFPRLFVEEIKWLKSFLPYQKELTLILDNYKVSLEDYGQSPTTNYYDFYSQKSKANFPELSQRLEKSKGRLGLRVQDTKDITKFLTP